jgi:hypothetical protein
MILGLELDATSVEIESAYSDLAKVWQPDRFQNDPRLSQKAEDILKKINEAYQILQSRRPSREANSSPTIPARQDSELPVSVAELRKCGVSDVAVVQRGMQALCEAGLAAEDIADAVLDSPCVLDALREGDYDKAKQLAFSRMTESLAYLQASGVPEDRLRVLSEAGLAIGEVAWALRNIIGLRDTLVDGDCEDARRETIALHKFHRSRGRTR